MFVSFRGICLQLAGLVCGSVNGRPSVSSHTSWHQSWQLIFSRIWRWSTKRLCCCALILLFVVIALHSLVVYFRFCLDTARSTCSRCKPSSGSVVSGSSKPAVPTWPLVVVNSSSGPTTPLESHAAPLPAGRLAVVKPLTSQSTLTPSAVAHPRPGSTRSGHFYLTPCWMCAHSSFPTQRGCFGMWSSWYGSYCCILMHFIYY